MPGAIFEAELDLTHPICFGYGTSRLFANAVFFGNLINTNGTERK
jgi:hypothetical protein